MAEPEKQEQSNRLSPQTLVLASISSAAAMFIASLIWVPGTLFFAATMPVLVSLISEALRRPTERVTQRTQNIAKLVVDPSERTSATRRPGALRRDTGTTPLEVPGEEAGAPPPDVRAERTTRSARSHGEETRARAPGARAGETRTQPLGAAGDDHRTRPLDGRPGETRARSLGPPPGPTDEEPAGARAEDDVPESEGEVRVYGRRRGLGLLKLGPRRTRMAIITGILAFLIAAAVITIPEIVSDRSLASGERKTTLFGGGGAAIDEEAPTEGVDPGQEREPVPGAPAPEGEQPAPAPGDEPAPGRESPRDSPAPEQEGGAPAQPAPSPGGQPAPEAPAP